MAIRHFTILALIFFAIIGMAFAAPDAPSPSSSPEAASGGDAASGGAPGAAADGAAAGAPADGGVSDASIFKVSIVGTFVNVASAALFLY